MSHLRCNNCGSTDHVSGYGFAAGGGIGGYSICTGCERVLEFHPDTEGDDEATAERRIAAAEERTRDAATPTGAIDGR